MRPTVIVLTFALAGCAPAVTPSTELAPLWDDAQVSSILERTQRIHLAPDLSALTEGERGAVRELLAAGERMHRLYLSQRHPQALAAADFLESRPALTGIRDLFRMNIGPIATTLENSRQPILSVDPESPTRNLYPAGTTREQMDAFLLARPDREADILNPRTIVQANTPDNRARALATLDRHPVLEALHPNLRRRLTNEINFLVLPYSVAFADDLIFITDRLYAAAFLVAEGDPAFARYLRLRARDLLADDYEGGDAAWVTGHFTGNLNAQIGAYETYDDALYGVKTSFSLSVLQRDRARSDELQIALGEIQRVQDALPMASGRRIRTDIPVGVYNVIADFGQARGTNTATILPNEAYLARQYGRTILMRGNILLNDDIFQETHRAFEAAVIDTQGNDLTTEGGFYRTLWHEVGHYLGVDQTADGRDLSAALQDTADLLEEMKADLVSLVSARILRARGYLTEAQRRSIEAAGIRRVLQKNQPRREQPYQTMQLMQWNWYLEHGALRFDNGRLAINYARYPAAVDSLLREVLTLQRNGDREAANAFIGRWTTWTPQLHDVIAARMRDHERTRFSLVTYEALDGSPAR